MNPRIVKRHDISKELKSLVDATIDLPRGSFVSHDRIHELTGFRPRTYPHGFLIAKWKRTLLRDRSIAIIAATPNGTGYHFCTVQEQLVQVPDACMKSAMKRTTRAATAVGLIAASELSNDQQAFQEVRLQQLGSVKQMTREHRALNASYLSNPKTLPRPSRKAIA